MPNLTPEQWAQLAFAFAVLLALGLAFRWALLWYFKIHRAIELLTSIDGHLSALREPVRPEASVVLHPIFQREL